MCFCKTLVKMELSNNVENVLSMIGGHGEHSYAANSRYQERALRFLKPFLEECILEMNIISCERFCIADMGCSVGPNTLFVADTISRAVQKKHSSSMPMPDLHVFFSDLPSNDFNTLLQDIHNNNGTSTPCKYYAAAVAGSFRGRLFPKRSLQFVHSSHSLQILSRIPPEVVDRWNGEVARAYLCQFQEDTRRFLRARGEEVVEGGRMFLFLPGREGCDPTDQGSFSWMREILNSALDDVFAMGDQITDRRTIEKINLPLFYPSVEEVRAEVEKEGSFREIRMQFVRQQVKAEDAIDEGFGKMVVKQVRAGMEPLLARHLGGDAVEAVLERYAVRAQAKASSLSRFLSQVEGILALLERV